MLARDDTGRPLGCARLNADHKIERMAVREPWRGRGVGAALLRELIARARAQGSGRSRARRASHRPRVLPTRRVRRLMARSLKMPAWRTA